MGRPSRDAVEKVAFVIGVAFLAVLYGYLAHDYGWFPAPLFERAGQQARAVAPLNDEEPGFVYPRVHERSGVRVIDSSAVRSGYTLITSVWKDYEWGPGLRLFDPGGRVVHEWRVRPEELFSASDARRGPIPMEHRNLHGTHLLENGDVLVNVEPAGTVRLDACSRVLWSLAEGGHHSIERADDGTFWIPGMSQMVDPETPDHPSGLPGLETPVFMDRILRVSPEGDLLRSINVLDVLWKNDLERHLLLSGRKGSIDPTHLNDVEPLPDSLAREYPLFESGDLLVSLRNLHLVLVLDPESERVKWYRTGPFIMQHDPDWIGDGWIGVFDNNRDHTDRGTMLGGSRIVALQPETGETRVLFPSEDSPPFHTDRMGKWQRLANGNLLLTESFAGRVLEVTASGQATWEWVARPYDEGSVPWVQQGRRVDLTPETVESWDCPEGDGVAVQR